MSEAKLNSNALLGPFLDELDACEDETSFWNSLLDGKSPSRIQGQPHKADGSTTIVYQRSVPVGITVLFRDDFNRTFLATTDLRPNK